MWTFHLTAVASVSVLQRLIIRLVSSHINTCAHCSSSTPSLELHCQVWSRLCKARPTGTEQREDAAEDGGLRLDWKSWEWQGNVITGVAGMVWKLFAETSVPVMHFLREHVYYGTNACLCLPQTLSFSFHPCGKIPPPVIMVQNVSFKYSDDTVSSLGITARTELWPLARGDISHAHSGHVSYSRTYIKTWSLASTWTHEWLWWGPTEQGSPHCWSCWWER